MLSFGKLTATSALAALSLMFVACDKDDDNNNGSATGDDDDDAGGGDDDDDANNECQPGADECPADQKCQPYVKEDGGCCVDAARCVPLEGDKKHGEQCTRTRYGDDCGRDVFCMGPTSGDEGSGEEFQCYALCDAGAGRATSCGELGLPEAVCNPYNNGVLPWCDIPCHPLRPSACQEGEGCYPFLDGHWCFPPDIEEGTSGTQGSVCVEDAEHSCQPGFYCNYISPETIPGCAGTACCTAYCDLEGDGSECQTPAKCLPFWGEGATTWEPEFKTEVGHCVTE